MKDKKIEENIEDDSDGFWEKGYFAQTMGAQEIEEKMKTFHNDDCFNKEYFPSTKAEEHLERFF